MTRGMVLALCLLAPAMSQAAPSQAALDEAVRLGGVAALAPLCGLRAESWAFDLRRAAIFGATRATRPSDQALRDAPDSQMVVGALSFGEAEALEEFAKAAPAETCSPLKIDPDLARADDIVRAFLELKTNVKPAS